MSCFDNGQCEVRIDLDRLDAPFRSIDELRAITRAAEAAATFVENLR